MDYCLPTEGECICPVGMANPPCPFWHEILFFEKLITIEKIEWLYCHGYTA
jgi:hypothetical protein